MSDGDAKRCELLSWARCHELCRRIAAQVEEARFAPEGIVAIARGGYAPARVLCDYLRVMELTGIRVAHYRGMTPTASAARIVDPLSMELSRRRVLVVDDVSDTGDTFNAALAHLRSRGEPSDLRTAVLLHKTTSRITPDFWGAVVRRWRWVIFPWARVEDVANLIARLPGGSSDREYVARALRERHGVRVAARTIDDALRFGERWRRPNGGDG